LACHCIVSAALFVVVAISLLSSLSPLPPAANELQLHTTASHLSTITILITVKLAIDLAITDGFIWMIALTGWFCVYGQCFFV
jgi:hypothetical protein